MGGGSPWAGVGCVLLRCMSCCGVWRLAAVYVLLWCVVLWWVLLGCVLLWCDVVLCYAVLYGRRNLTKNPSLKLSGICFGGAQ